MWKVLRFLSMLMLAGTALMNVLVALVLFVGGDLLDTMGKHTDDYAEQQKAKPEEERHMDPEEAKAIGKDIRSAGKDVKQIAGWIALLAVTGFVAIAYMYNRNRLIGPIAALAVVGGEIAFGAWSSFGRLVMFGILGGALAFLSWCQLRSSRHPDAKIYG
jgi:1,4-dihydroxy-2-naphthoate octaprenyltransferase